MATNGAPIQEEKINVDIVTLTRFLTEEQAKHKEATGDFTYAFDRLRRVIYTADILTDFSAMLYSSRSNR